MKKHCCLWLITGLLLCLGQSLFATVNVVPTKELSSITISKGVPLNQPTDITVGAKGKIYLLDGVNNRVIVFSASLGYLSQFGRKGHKKGELWFPVGIASDRHGNIYVADSQNHRINIYDEQGIFESSFDIEWKEPQMPADPTDLVIDDDTGNCYVVDNDNHRIMVYSKEGKLNFQWGFKGRRKGEFRYPFTIAMDSQRNLYIVDVINSRVQVFNAKGEFLNQIGRWGITPGTFYRPKGISINNDKVYVSGSYVGYGNIQVFSLAGEFLGVLGNIDKKALKFNTPMGLYVYEETNKLLVVEQLANRVRIFQLQ